MVQHATSADFQPQRIETLPSRVGPLGEPAMTEERLPFTVRLVRDEDDLDKAVQIRHSAYARHLPDFAESLKAPESAELISGGNALFFAKIEFKTKAIRDIAIMESGYLSLEAKEGDGDTLILRGTRRR